MHWNRDIMLWSEVEYLFGKDIAEDLKHSPYLKGITVVYKNGEFDYPLEDIRNAFRWLRGLMIEDWMWD